MRVPVPIFDNPGQHKVEKIVAKVIDGHVGSSELRTYSGVFERMRPRVMVFLLSRFSLSFRFQNLPLDRKT